MTRPRKPKLPLRCGRDGGQALGPGFDRNGLVFAEQEIAWLNRAAAQWPKLRRGLREALDNLEGYIYPGSGADENEVGLLMSLYGLLGKRDRAAFVRRWNEQRRKRQEASGT